MDRRETLEALFRAAVASADPARCVPPNLPEPPKGRTVVVGAGKAAAAMAAAVEAHWPGPLEGLVVTRYGHGAPCRRIEVVEAGHPVPDAAGEDAARRIAALASGAGADDLVLCLLSGGGSALLALPLPGIALSDKQAAARALLRSGASIAEINCVRKHMSAVKGGRLALAASPARVATLAISDVPGDDPAVIASGPTTGDPTTLEEAFAIVERYRVPLPSAVRAAMAETPKPGDPRLPPPALLIARPMEALEAAAREARARGYDPIILGDAIEGEARDVGRAHAGLALEALARGRRTALISGGETTVTVCGRGRGGRNSEYLLALTLALGGRGGLSALAADTDGVDGSEENAGAVTDATTLARAKAAGLDGEALLEANDAYGFFAALGDLVVTGPTRTNVNDFRVILVEPDQAAGSAPA